MSGDVYTLGVWRVKDGKQSEFVEAWKRLGRHFGDLAHPPGEGTLLQSLDDPRQFYSFGPWRSLDDPRQFYSFGPWRSLDDIQAMRDHPDTPQEIGALMELCEEGRPGTFRVVATG